MRRKYFAVFLAAAAMFCCWIAYGQSVNGNWPTHGGDAQRSNWERTDASINKDSVKDLRLLWKVKLETSPNGVRPVMPPLILSRLISYRGFKELGFLATNADVAYAIDVDLGKIFWTRHLEYSVREPQATTSTAACPGGLTAAPTMPTAAPANSNAARGAAGGRGNPFIGGAASVYTISSDGRLHRLNTSTGDDMTQPVSVIPPNALASHLLMVDNVVYTTTSNDCNGAPNAVWAVDLNGDAPKTRSFPLNSNDTVGGIAMGSNGMVYVKTESPSSVDGGLQVLTTRDLESKAENGFRLLYGETAAPPGSSFAEESHSTPSVFSYRNRDLVVAPCHVKLCIADSASHSLLPISSTDLLNQTEFRASYAGISEQLSTWQEADGTRWVLAAAVGPLNPALKPLATNGTVTNGFIAAFKVEDQNGQPVLTPVWMSRDMDSPQPPVVANGVVFALAAGEFTRRVTDSGAIEEKPKSGARATLYALDAKTGKELYSSKNLIPTAASLTGLTVATGRVYFGGLDGNLYAFGMYMEH